MWKQMLAIGIVVVLVSGSRSDSNHTTPTTPGNHLDMETVRVIKRGEGLKRQAELLVPKIKAKLEVISFEVSSIGGLIQALNRNPSTAKEVEVLRQNLTQFIDLLVDNLRYPSKRNLVHQNRTSDTETYEVTTLRPLSRDTWQLMKHGMVLNNAAQYITAIMQGLTNQALGVLMPIHQITTWLRATTDPEAIQIFRSALSQHVDVLQDLCNRMQLYLN